LDVVTTRRRLTAGDRRQQLLDAAAELFARKPYDSVSMEEVAARSGISRALLYRHFPSKRELFAAIYRQAAQRLLAQTELVPQASMTGQIALGLDAHIDYFIDNRNTVLAANRTLAGDPVIQAIIDDELEVLRGRMLAAAHIDDTARPAVSAVLMSWLVFVRALSVEWLANEPFDRTALRDMCLGALTGALDARQYPNAPSSLAR
jgi:AcrR family transcriptional regulator